MKICAKCATAKPITEFHRQAAKPDGLHPWCKDCARDHRLLTHNAEKVREYRKEKNIRDRERNAERWAAYYQEHKETISQRKSEYVKNNPLKYANYAHRRRSLLANAGFFTESEWTDLCAKYDNTCVFPGCKETSLTVDHVVPLSKGGANTIDNIQPLCKGHNSSKYNKTIDYR